MTKEEAIAKANQFIADYTNPNEDQFDRKECEDEFAQRHMFEDTFNEWLRTRGTNTDTATKEELDALCEHEWDLAERILSMPVVSDWMIFSKFEVINHCITKHDEASGSEILALMALDGIKADLLRLALKRERDLEKELRKGKADPAKAA